MKQAARMVLEKYAGDIPNSVQGLMEIPGVGEKMVCMHPSFLLRYALSLLFSRLIWQCNVRGRKIMGLV